MRTSLTAIVFAVATFATVLLFGASSVQAQKNVTVQASPSSSTFEVVHMLDAVKPAEVVVLPLADLGLPNAVEVTVSGAITEALIRDGTLRFWTPGDTGAPQRAEFTLVNNNATTTILVQPITTERPLQPFAVVETEEDGSTLTPPNMTISGLGPNNSITNSPLIFRIEGMPPLNLSDDSNGLISGLNNVSVSLKPYWTFNADDNSFSISGARLQSLLAALPRGSVTMSLNFVSKDGEFAVLYYALATRLGATLSGRLVTTTGQPINGLSGKKILLRGFNQHIRQTAEIDASGQFMFTNLVPDTYKFTLNDLNNPNVVSASAAVFEGSTSASVTIIYGLGSSATYSHLNN